VKYRVVFTEKSKKQLSKLDKSISALIIGWIERILFTKTLNSDYYKSVFTIPSNVYVRIVFRATDESGTTLKASNIANYVPTLVKIS